jgi:hypothetical protein
MQRGRSRTCVWRPKMLLLETEDACSVDDDYCLLLPLVFLPWSLVCAFLLFLFLCFVCSVFLGLIVAGCCGLFCFWVDCCWVLWVAMFLGPLCVLFLWFSCFSCSGSASLFLWFSAPFIETQPLASNLQDCYLPRQDRGRETWSTISFVADYLPCWIGSSPVEAGWKTHGC